jgi:hypothetical protein
VPPARLLLWQPVTNGSGYLTQFLRLRLANANAGRQRQRQRRHRSLRERWPPANRSRSPATARAATGAGLDAADARALGPAPARSLVRDVGQPGRPLPPAAVRVAAPGACRAAGVDVHLAQGPQFWTAPGNGGLPALLDATLGLPGEASRCST